MLTPNRALNICKMKNFIFLNKSLGHVCFRNYFLFLFLIIYKIVMFYVNDQIWKQTHIKNYDPYPKKHTHTYIYIYWLLPNIILHYCHIETHYCLSSLLYIIHYYYGYHHLILLTLTPNTSQLLLPLLDALYCFHN